MRLFDNEEIFLSHNSVTAITEGRSPSSTLANDFFAVITNPWLLFKVISNIFKT